MNDSPAPKPAISPDPFAVLEAHPASDLVPETSPPGLQLATVPLAAMPPAQLPQRNPIQRGHRGKIARLPAAFRDMVNRMLRNNVAYSRIVDALDEYGFKVIERNISNWKKHGGYKEWCLAQDHAAALHVHQDNLLSLLRRENASEIPEVGLQVAATRLAEFFLTPAADELFVKDPAEYRRRSAHLAQLTAQINNLQKYRDASAREAGFKYDPELNRRKLEEDVEETRKIYSAEINPNAKASDPVSPHRNFLPKSSE